MGNFRGGNKAVTGAVRWSEDHRPNQALLDELERNQAGPEGNDGDLIAELQRMSAETSARPTPPPPMPTSDHFPGKTEAPASAPGQAGEIPAEAMERARRMVRPTQTGKQEAPPATRAAEPKSETKFEPKAEAKSGPLRRAAGPDKPDVPTREDDRPDAKVASQSIRVHLDTLEHLMTMVSELVLTRNQLIEIVRRHEDSEFKVRCSGSNVTAELQDGVLKTRMQPIGNAWQKLPRIVRDLSAELGKPIELEMQGPTPSSTARCSTSSRTR